MFGIELDNGTIATIITTVFVVLGALGISFVGYKKALNVAKEFVDLVMFTIVALQDKQVTPEEVEQWKKERNEFVEAIKDFKNNPSEENKTRVVSEILKVQKK